MTGKCKLCLRENTDLQRSHLLPAAVYRALREDINGNNPNPYQITREGSVQSSKQQWAFLLCSECEARLSRCGEDWIFRNGLRRDGTFPVASALATSAPSVGTATDSTRLYEARLIPQINSEAIIHFAIGMFWKASIYPWNSDGSIPVNLFSYGDQFRRFILGIADFPRHATLTVNVREGGQIDRLSYAPTRGISRGQVSNYRFTMPGYFFMLTVGRKIPEQVKQYCFVRGDGQPLVVTPAIEQFLLVEAKRTASRFAKPKAGTFLKAK